MPLAPPLRSVSISEYPLAIHPGHDLLRNDYAVLTHPLLTAEQIGSDALQAWHIRNLRRRAWRDLEVAIAHPDLSQKATLLDVAEKNFQEVLPKQSDYKRAHDVQVVLTSFDLFRKRAYGQPYTAEDARRYYLQTCSNLLPARKQLNDLSRSLNAQEIYDDPLVADLRGIVAEEIAKAVLARVGVIALPASIREEASSWPDYNHDLVIPWSPYKRLIAIKYGKPSKSPSEDIYCQRIGTGLGKQARLAVSHLKAREQYESIFNPERDRPHVIGRIIEDDVKLSLKEDSVPARIIKHLGEYMIQQINMRPVFKP